ncbi:MAG: hypothetical protein QXY99_07655 [Thermoproteota archaeon]
MIKRKEKTMWRKIKSFIGKTFFVLLCILLFLLAFIAPFLAAAVSEVNAMARDEWL